MYTSPLLAGMAMGSQGVNAALAAPGKRRLTQAEVDAIHFQNMMRQAQTNMKSLDPTVVMNQLAYRKNKKEPFWHESIELIIILH